MDNPQDLINQALGGNTPATPTEPATPTLPTPEPLSPTTTTESPTETPSTTSETPTTSVQPDTTQAQPALATDVVVPTELTNDSSAMTTATTVPDATTTEQPVMPEISNVEAKGEDVPLALVGAAPIAADTTTVSTPIVEPIASSVPAADITSPTASVETPKKKSKLKTVGLVAAIFVMLGLVGGIAYNYFGNSAQIAKVQIGNKGPVKDIDNKEDCSGESNGGWLVWRNGECKVTGISGSDDKDGDGVGDKDTTDPNLANLEEKGESACKNTPGAQWCTNFGFCMKNDGSEGNCNNRAVQLGYTVQIGNVSCVKKNGAWIPDGSYRQGDSLNSDGTAKNDSSVGAVPTTSAEDRAIYGDVMSVYEQVDKQCKAQSGVFTAAGKESYICKEGVAGIGGVVYSGGACTELNGKKFTGSLGCFCGTVQVDTTNGHTSYSSTCGCNETNVTENSPSPSPSGSVSFMCNTLTRTPTTTPAMGDKLTFTCAGAATPAGSVSLTYKFRYNINDGAYTALTNKTATTAEMTIAQCGRYKVQCQACGTINGVLSCDPVWTPATTQ